MLDAGIHLSRALEKPSLDDLLGRDVMGRSVLARCLQSFYLIVLPVWAASFFSFFLGVFLAWIFFYGKQRRVSRFFLKIFDKIIFFLSTCPAFLLAIALSIFFEKVQLSNFILICALISFVHGYFEVIYLYQRDHLLGYWQMHGIHGGSLQERILTYGILDHWKKTIFDRLISLLRLCFLLEVCLSYLGFGIPEPHPSFGNILASHFNFLFSGAWHPLLEVGLVFLFLLFLPSLVFRFFSKHFSYNLFKHRAG